MGTVNAAVITATRSYPNGGALPVIDPVPISAEAITSSGTSAQSSNSVPTPANGVSLIWHLVSDTAVWVKFGSNPTAAAGDDYYLPAELPMQFAANPGDKVAVIDA